MVLGRIEIAATFSADLMEPESGQKWKKQRSQPALVEKKARKMPKMISENSTPAAPKKAARKPASLATEKSAKKIAAKEPARKNVETSAKETAGKSVLRQPTEKWPLVSTPPKRTFHQRSPEYCEDSDSSCEPHLSYARAHEGTP